VWQVNGQATSATSPSPVIEGGKLVVELIKVFSGRKDQASAGCKNSYADICIANESVSTFTVSLQKRFTNELREVVVLPAGRECSLQVGIGVWTYDLKIPGNPTSMRKGDILVEACNNVEMKVK
jgi:hypothetical protein